jgi:hypothetical protein
MESRIKSVNRVFLFLILLVLVACQARPTVVGITPTTSPATATLSVKTSPKPTVYPTATIVTVTPTAPTATPEPVFAKITTTSGQAFSDIQLQSFQPATYTVGLDKLPINLATLGNPGVIGGLTAQQKQFLSKNGFVVIQSDDQQFRDIRIGVANADGQPYYLTTDAAYHALHVTFNGLLQALEQESLRPVMERLIEALYDKVGSYLTVSQGTTLESDVRLAQNYLGVALILIDPEATLDPKVAEAIAPQLAQIKAEAGKQPSALIPGFEDDYGAYRPTGHYAGIPELENYFRVMTWLGRVAFEFKNLDQPGLTPSRAPLIITLALSTSTIADEPAAETWAKIYEILDFLVGPSDDPGPVELSALMEQVYGAHLTLSDLSDDSQWQAFLLKTDELPAPAINSTFASYSTVTSNERNWRFMGQRFTLDAFIFQNLIYDKVGTPSDPREFPSGLDVAAAFGSKQALDALATAGATHYANYPQQMTAVQTVVQNQPEAEWLNRFYTSWLYAFLPQVRQKNEGYPPYMTSDAWGYKDANSLLGSWAELKHDTVLYAKMPEAAGGGGPLTSGPPPAYVEPNPNVFYRLAYAANALHEGLNSRVADWYEKNWTISPQSTDPLDQPLGFQNYLSSLSSLAKNFQTFGDIAVRELQGQALTPEDYAVIMSCLEPKECLNQGAYSINPPESDPIPVIAAVSGAKDEVLEAGVGYLNRIYVAVPLEGKLQIAQGGVFSYYEFTQPRSDRLTDAAWQEKLANGSLAIAAWQRQFLLPGGAPTHALAFRVGDIYILTKEGANPPLNVRAGPSRSAEIVGKLDQAGEFLEITEGPVVTTEGTWWKIKSPYDAGDIPVGWILENQDWLVRMPGFG